MYHILFRTIDAVAQKEPSEAEIQAVSRYFTLFVTLQLIGLSGLMVMFFTACVTSIIRKRHLCWTSFILSWIVSSVSYSLLVGTSIEYQPPFALCLIQGVMIYTVPTLTACTSLSLVIQVLLTVRTFASPPHSPSSTAPSSHRLSTFMLILLPYVFGAAMFTLSMVIGLKDRETVTRPPGGFYCNMKNSTPGKISAIVVAIIMLICVGLGSTISVILRRHWLIFSNQTRTPLATAMRVLCFSAFSVVSIVLGLVFFFTPRSSHGPGLEIVLSLMPVAAALVFGTQKDLVQSWKNGFLACFHPFQSYFNHLPFRKTRSQTSITTNGSLLRLFRSCDSHTSSTSSARYSFNEEPHRGIPMEHGLVLSPV